MACFMCPGKKHVNYVIHTHKLEYPQQEEALTDRERDERQSDQTARSPKQYQQQTHLLLEHTHKT
jgi:hypothetical protein